MAVESLFGVSPEALQAQRAEDQRKQAMQFAQMTPGQASQFMAYQAGSGIGNALGGMMGAKDPELEKAAQVKSLMQGTDTTTPEGLLAAAQKAKDAGDMGRALALVKAAKELQLQQAKTDTETAQGAKYMTEAVAKQAEQKSKALGVAGRKSLIMRLVKDVSPEEAEALAQDEKVAADLLKEPKRETKTVTADGLVKLIDSSNGSTIAVIGKAPASMEEALAGGLSSIRNETAQMKLDAERQKADDVKKAKVNALTSGYYDTQNVLQTATKALGLAPGSFTGASIQALTQVIPWSDSKALNNLVDTLKSAEGLGKLQELKRMSANGASGLGATSEKEIDLLIKSLTALDPTDKNFKAQLSTVITRYNRLSKLMEADFKGLTGRPLMSEAEEAPMDEAPTPTKAPARVKWGDMQSTK